MTIPDWNSSLVLPPIRPGQPGHSADRSPYRVPLTTVVERFAHTPERCKILRGLLAYRKELFGTGILGGFQWLDGSFMEHKEEREGRAPNDIDVVTFYRLPPPLTQMQLVSTSPQLFDPLATLETYSVDSLHHQLGLELSAYDVRQISYYYSMWSHRRNGMWKGFLEVELSQEENERAISLLEHLEREGGRP